VIFIAVSSFNALAQTPFFTNDGQVISITSGTRVTITGPASNNGTILNEGTLSVSGDWRNIQTYLSQNGKFVLNGVTAQIIDHNGQNFYTLELASGGIKTFVSDIEVINELILVSGVAEVANERTFLLREGGFVTGGSGQSYINGAFVNSGTGDLFFPIGTEDIYAPVRLLDVEGTSPVTKMQVVSANPNATIGSGIDQLSDQRFWERTLLSGTFDGSRVEISLINESIPAIRKAVVAGSNEAEGSFVSLGQRNIVGDVNEGIVESNSFSDHSVYAVASELNEGRLADSLALVAIYDATNGTNWTRNNGWLETGTSIDLWEGVTLNPNSGRVIQLNFSNNNMSGELPIQIRSLTEVTVFDVSINSLGGALPTQVAQMNALIELDLSNNEFTSLPNLNALTSLNQLDVFGNNFQFNDLETNIGIVNFNYDPQDSIGIGGVFLLDKGESFTITLEEDSPINSYQWYFNEEVIQSETDRSIEIIGLDRESAGNYRCEVTNSQVPELTLFSKNTALLPKASINGNILIDDGGFLENGTAKLLRISDGPYDTLRAVPLLNGTYIFDDVVLGDYIVLAQPFEEDQYLPTYHEQTIQWDEANILVLEGDTSQINVQMESIPDPITSGDGSLNGVVYSDFADQGTQGRIEARRRVQRVGCALRRRRGQGRSDRTSEDDEFELIAYQLTDDEGRFSFGELPAGLYRIFIEYPGIPIDESSFTEFEISDGLEENEITVEVTVFEDEIVIDLVKETGIAINYLDEINVFPNPTNGNEIYINIEARNNYEVQFELIDLSGNRVLIEKISSIEHGNETKRLDLTKISSGIYLMKVTIPTLENQILNLSKLIVSGR